MIDWIKYLPIKLRYIDKLKKHPAPKGPSFTFARSLRYSINGSELTFKAPKHRPSHPSDKAYNAGHYQDLLNFRFNAFNEDEMPDDSWLYQSIFHRAHAFYGPWFTGVQYQLNISAILITPRQPITETSFFHPRVFENSLSNYLSSLYDHDVNEARSRWTAPINWSPINNLPVPAASFNIIPNLKNNDDRMKQILCLPLSDDHILVVSLTHNLYNHNLNISLKKLKELFDVTPMETLANDIINSFQLTLSPEAQAQYDKVKAICPDMSLVEEFAPLKWSTDANSHPHNELPSIESKTA